MSRRAYRTALRGCLATFTLFALACGEQSPTRPVPESEVSTAQGPATKAAQEAQINGLIDALYAPQEQGAVKSQFARIKAQVASNRTAEAQTSIVAFVQALLADLENGDLADPNGAQPPSTADALASLVNAVAQFGGLPAPIPPSNPLGGDGAVAVVGPAGGHGGDGVGLWRRAIPAGGVAGERDRGGEPAAESGDADRGAVADDAEPVSAFLPFLDNPAVGAVWAGRDGRDLPAGDGGCVRAADADAGGTGCRSRIRIRRHRRRWSCWRGSRRRS